MNQKPILLHYGVLLVLGTSWGLSTPLSKIAVSTGHGEFGLIFWQLVIGAVLMAALMLASGDRLPLNRRALGAFVVIALTGTVLPDAAFYGAIRHLPAGVMAILISLVPMFALPMALALRLERFSLTRMVGITAGLAGVLLLIVPEASLPQSVALIWIALALIAPLSYSFETIYVAKWGVADMTPVQVMLGMSLTGALITLPLAVSTGQFINPIRVWAAPEWAFVASAVIHAMVYAGYVWLVGRAGAVFAVQVSYLVTGFGVIWAIILLQESYSSFIWAALALVLIGIFLVQPRAKPAPEQATP